MMSKLRSLLAAGIAAMMSLPAAAQPAADTVAAIRARGTLLCGVTPNSPGFAAPNSRGEWRGLDADSCRAIAVAVLGDATKVRFVPTSTAQRFTTLQSGEIDVLARVTTWSMQREGALGLAFASINMFDGQGFIVKTDSGVTSVRQLSGATICVLPGTTTELNVADYFRTHGMTFQPVIMENIEELRSAFLAGRCDAYSTDSSALATYRAAQGANADRFLVLPDLISKEPLAIAVRTGDWRFFDMVRWAHYAMVTAEELGITSANIDSFTNNPNPDVQRFLGRTGDLGQAMNMNNDWSAQIVRQVGNFAEVWDRNLAPLGLQRGLNNLWNKGGLQYAPPLR